MHGSMGVGGNQASRAHTAAQPGRLPPTRPSSERLIWRTEVETLDQSQEIQHYIDRYAPPSPLGARLQNALGSASSPCQKREQPSGELARSTRVWGR